MQLSTTVQSLWLLWSDYWANDILAMVMATLCSQQISDIVRRLFYHFGGGNNYTLTSLKSLELQTSTKISWSRLLLNISYAVQFPITAAFHPLVSGSNINDWRLMPNLPQLIGQILVFLVLDYGCRQLFAGWLADIYEDEDDEVDECDSGSTSALEVATDFTASGTTLVLAITAIGLSSKLKLLTGDLHFAAILCWLLIRKYP